MPDSNEYDPRLLRIARVLLEKTQRGGIDWERTTFHRSEAFSYSTEYSTVVIRVLASDTVRVVQFGEDFPIEMSILDSDGVVLESLRTGFKGSKEDEEILPKLLRIARHESLQVDNKLDQLLSELGLEK